MAFGMIEKLRWTVVVIDYGHQEAALEENSDAVTMKRVPQSMCLERLETVFAVKPLAL